MARINPGRFFREVRQETAKVTWPSRNETMVTTIMVFVMVTIAALFFLAVDQTISLGLRYILGVGG